MTARHHYTEAEQREIIQRIDKGVLSFNAALAEAGIGPNTYYRWKQKLFPTEALSDFSTNVLLDELRRRAQHIAIGIQEPDGHYYISVNCDKTTFITLLSLLDLQQERNERKAKEKT